MARVESFPNPPLLIWARESAGYTQELLAKKLKIGLRQLQLWEEGSSRPSVSQLRRIGAITKRPLAVFYLPEPPRKFEALHDFRAGSGTTFIGIRSPSLTFEIRKAHDRREWALELLQRLESEPPRFSVRTDLDQPPEATAERLRAALGVKMDAQTEWRPDYEAFRWWRKILEGAGILTFQSTEIDLSEARGFSLSLKPLPVIVVNIKDAPKGRIFTLLHELAHIAVNDGGVCDLNDNKRQNASASIEAYCNRVAGAVLYPKRELLATDVIRDHPQNQRHWSDEEIITVSRKFGGSRDALLVRLLTLGLTDEKFYLRKKEEYAQEYAKLREHRKPGFALPHVVAVASAGPLFTGLVIEGFNRERITASDVSDYLEVRVKHLNAIQRDFLRQAE